MNLNESPDEDWWIGTYTADGRWISASSDHDTYLPRDFRADYAKNVVKHLNRQYSAGGAWLGGWIRGGRTFYLLWKDKDGDIQVPIESDKPFITLAKWSVYDWERHAVAALGVWSEWTRDLELGAKQQVNVAAGEKISPTHHAEAEKFVVTP